MGGLNKKSDFYCKFWTPGAYNVVKTSLLNWYAPSGELGLYLGEPNFRIHRPEGSSFMPTTARVGGGAGASSSAIVG